MRSQIIDSVSQSDVVGIGTRGIWATSLCNLFVALDPAQGQSHMYHFYVTVGGQPITNLSLILSSPRRDILMTCPTLLGRNFTEVGL